MSNKNAIPREEGMDQTLNLLREGYMYISNRCHSFHTYIFQTRLFGQKAICMRGAEAAEIFYDNEKFMRKGAIPKRIIHSFLGKNSVQTLDENIHQHRKEILMSVMTPNQRQQLIHIIKQQWEKVLYQWEQMDQVILYEEIQKLLCRAACEWLGVPLAENEINKKTKQLASLFESAAAIGPDYWGGRSSRRSLDKWISGLIDRIRDGDPRYENTILYQFAMYNGIDGKLCKSKTIAVEVINLLRPIVAVSIYINFLLLSVHNYPEKSEKLKSDDGKYVKMFVQEVRRYYPFFPFIAAIVKKDFIWDDYKFEKDTLTILDIYGTNHDPEIWENPDLFSPERFENYKGSSFGFIPQGGGDYWMGHRCAGEWITVEIMKLSLHYLINQMDYEVPEQDLSFSMVQMPSIPHSKIIIKNVKRRT